MQVIHGREVPDGHIEAAKEFISLAISALATERDRRQKTLNANHSLVALDQRDQVQECLDEISTVQWHVLALKEVTSGTR